MSSEIILKRQADKDSAQIRVWRFVGHPSALHINRESLICMIAGESPAEGLQAATPYRLKKLDSQTYQLAPTDYKLTNTNTPKTIKLIK